MMLDFFFNWLLGGGMKKPEPSRKPGQHEDQLAALARIEEAVKKPIKIEIKCSCCVETQKEILALVKEILSKINDSANSATKEEVDAILGPVLERLKQVSTNLN